MLKLIGALLLTAAGTAAGLRSAQRLRQRAKSLASLVSALDVMRAEICTRLTPMPELMELLARQSAEPARLFFAKCALGLRTARGRGFGEIWLSAARDTPELMLRPPESEALGELSRALGRYDGERQGEAIDKARGRLAAFLNKAEDERDREFKTRAVLGVAAGAAAAILLI